MNKAEIKATLVKMLAKCEQVNINGQGFFGEILPKDKEGITVIQNAVEEQSTLESTVKTWIQAQVTGKLTSLKISGDTQIVVKTMNDNDKDIIEVLTITAAQQIANAVPNLMANNVK